jgi:hypothetical protein
MTDRPNLISVDLGPVAKEALDALCKRTKKNQSTTIRDLILGEYAYGVIDRMENYAKGIKPPKHKTVDEERNLIEQYKETFNVQKRIFYPAALSAIRARIKDGLTYGELGMIIEVAANDDWIGQLCSRGETPTLGMILGEKMVAKLWPIAQEMADTQADKERLMLEGTHKPEALTILKEALTPDQYSVAWDMVKECHTREDVDRIVKAAMGHRFDEYVARVSI